VLPWLLLLVLLLAGGGGGAYWWFVLREPAPIVANAPPSPPTPPPAEPPAPRVPEPPRQAEPPLPPVRPQAEPTAPASLDSLAVPEVIARAASPAAIAEEAARRFDAGRHDDALLLWEAAARAGHAAAITRLAGLYDPVGFQPGRPFRDPDPRQAARHYRDAIAAGDAAAAEPRARLRRWLEDRAREGDINAPLTLRDFWQ
jgi:TPR repeat protein